jgi:hypothetical protein
MADTTTGTTTPSIYKTLPLADAKNRPMKALSNADKTKVDTIVSKFIRYMINKHS